MQSPYTSNNGWDNAYIQDTHKYNPDYSYLDDGHYTDWVWRELSSRFYPGEDYDEYGRYVKRIQVHGPHTLKEVHKAMSDHFREGCSCEHDCCGHIHGGVHGVVKPHNGKKNEYIVLISYGRNY